MPLTFVRVIAVYNSVTYERSMSYRSAPLCDFKALLDRMSAFFGIERGSLLFSLKDNGAEGLCRNIALEELEELVYGSTYSQEGVVTVIVNSLGARSKVDGEKVRAIYSKTAKDTYLENCDAEERKTSACAV